MARPPTHRGSPLLIIALLTAIVFDRLQEAENQRIRNQFERDAADVSSLIERRLLAQTDALRALERCVALTPPA